METKQKDKTMLTLTNVRTFLDVRQENGNLVAAFQPPASHQPTDKFAAKEWTYSKATLLQENQDLTSDKLDRAYADHQTAENIRAIEAIDRVVG